MDGRERRRRYRRHQRRKIGLKSIRSRL
jgi:hypothetical protein